MSWFVSHGKWNCKVSDGMGNRKSISSGIKASRKRIKWQDEVMSIKNKAEKAVMQRIGQEGMQVSRKSDEMTFGEVSAMYKENFNTDKYRMKLIDDTLADRQIDSITPLDILRFKKMAVSQNLWDGFEPSLPQFTPFPGNFPRIAGRWICGKLFSRYDCEIMFASFHKNILSIKAFQRTAFYDYPQILR